MFTLLLERQHDLISWVSSAAANQRGTSKKKSSGAWSRALANQTRAAESINITTSKIRAGVQLARRYRANTLNIAWLSLTNYVPAAANDRKQRLD